jgi:ABC-2 type transport system permease protein
MNAVGIRTLLGKEVRRFLRVPGQTVLQPLITTTLYFVVFGYSVGARLAEIEGVKYLHFIVPGLVFLAVANNSFLNSSSSFFIAKMQGTIVDLLVAPLAPLDLMVGFIAGAMVRGLLVGGLTWLAALVFAGPHALNVGATAVFLFLSAYVFGVLGLIAAIWAEKFEQVNFFPAFLVTPLTFLGGVFYPVASMGEPLRTLNLANPVVYMVDGLRAAMLGRPQPSAAGLVLLLLLSTAATALTWRLLKTGYRVKS